MVEGKITLVIHGGAGTILRENLSPEMREKYLAGLNDSLLAGYTLLKQGGSALDAVEAAVNSMEDNYLFNAGKGAVFTKGGKNELEASIMDGSNLKAGACTLLTTVKNPISLARQVMVQSPHNFLGGEAAEQLANKSGLDIVEPKYFFTEHRWKQHLSGLESPGNEPPAPAPKGTVGAVALDQFGNIATATSTGGKTNKWDGRIGDTPMIGAGTYADNETCGVSGTGDGEV
ncbi:hypothetical protein K7432_011543 [Basidiobolus ranarum]|uniref:Beta-aspartyl-peptidase n=1 Tax=Basidiobolus ranarum TaxID=34480 RepID=A0ABR2VTT8_9FUNG